MCFTPQHVTLCNQETERSIDGMSKEDAPALQIKHKLPQVLQFTMKRFSLW